jgi:hypothetical protein
MPAKLDSRAARTDLTDRECSKLLGGTIGGLMLMAGENEVRRAIRWWADLTDEQWAQFVTAERAMLGLSGPAH